MTLTKDTAKTASSRFSAFMDRMNAHYREQIVDIEVCVNG